MPRGSEEVILVRPGVKDRYGDPAGEATTLGIFEKCLVYPRVATEVENRGTQIIDGYNVWIPADVRANRDVIEEAVALKATDMVVARGQEWELEGTPADHRSMRGKALGVMMVLRRVA